MKSLEFILFGIALILYGHYCAFVNYGTSDGISYYAFNALLTPTFGMIFAIIGWWTGVRSRMDKSAAEEEDNETKENNEPTDNNCD